MAGIRSRPFACWLKWSLGAGLLPREIANDGQLEPLALRRADDAEQPQDDKPDPADRPEQEYQQGEEEASQASAPARAGRRDIWAATWEMFEAHPLAGVGFGGYWVAVSRYHEGSGRSVPQQAHSDYLETLASGGLIGAALVACFVFLFAGQSMPLLRRGSSFERAARLGALTGLCGVAAHSLVEFGLHVPSNAYAALALAAVAACRPRRE